MVGSREGKGYLDGVTQKKVCPKPLQCFVCCKFYPYATLDEGVAKEEHVGRFG